LSVRFFKDLERTGKRGIFAVLRWTCPEEAVEIPEGFTPERILWVRQDRRLGNLLLTLAAVRKAKRYRPEVYTAMLVCSEYLPLVENDPFVDEVIAYDRIEAIREPWKLVSVLRRLRSRRYDLVVDCATSGSASLSNGLWVRLSGGRWTVGYRRKNSECFLNHPIEFPPGEWHEADLQLHLLSRLLGVDPPAELQAEAPAGADRIALHLWQRLGLSPFRATVGVHLGGRGKKAYPDRELVRLLGMISSEGLQAVAIAGRAETSRLEVLKESLRGIWFLTDPALEELAAFVRGCEVVVAPDCGVLHLAVALGVRTVGIFVNSDPKRFGPRGNGNVVVGDGRSVPPAEEVKCAILEVLG